ncbi:hypothetical protein GCM10010218_37970 [Streptomyces mashuensis]|uniref:Uncharacterized protein n=1 Tax=Streptomyces mashuensis TaxID=33904 RepID=A0A919B696_9ACTN|nr:hypothetical protein [Streptomyces mashuensis]GHF52917.1 hypothetical protein GCM10010218_37970 [Streptomyces mashuensis]
MGDALFRFVYRTMHKRVNDETGKYWLPKVLKEARHDGGAPLLPVTAPKWDLGTLGGEPGRTMAETIADSWWAVLTVALGKDRLKEVEGLTSSPLKGKEFPTLAFSKVRVTGLENARLGEVRDLKSGRDGYTCVLPITFGAYKKPGIPAGITITGRYTLDQQVCAADVPQNRQEPKPYPPTGRKLNNPPLNFSWPVMTVQGQGEFTLEVTGVSFDVHISATVAGSGKDRVPAVAITRIGVPAAPRFVLDEKKLTIEAGKHIRGRTVESWKKSVKMLFQSDEAQKELSRRLLDSLNTSKNLEFISKALTGHVLSSLNGVLGTSPPAPRDSGGDGEATAVDLYLFDRGRAALNDSASGFHPPSVILSVRDPVLQPWALGTADLGRHRIDDDLSVRIELRKTTINGLANLLVPVDGTRLIPRGTEFRIDFGRITGRPRIPEPPLSFAADVHIAYNDDDFPPKRDAELVITADRPSVTAGLTFSGQDSDGLRIDLARARLGLDPDGLTVKLIGTGDIIRTVNGILQKPAVKKLLIGIVGKQADDRRDGISRTLTKYARAAIGDRLK